MNVLWTKPHVLAIGPLNLQPGEPGNLVTEEQLAALRGNAMFRELETMKMVQVRGDTAGAPKAIVAAVVDTGAADRELAEKAAAKKAQEDAAAAAAAGSNPAEGATTPPAGEGDKTKPAEGAKEGEDAAAKAAAAKPAADGKKPAAGEKAKPAEGAKG